MTEQIYPQATFWHQHKVPIILGAALALGFVVQVFTIAMLYGESRTKSVVDKTAENAAAIASHVTVMQQMVGVINNIQAKQSLQDNQIAGLTNYIHKLQPITNNDWESVSNVLFLYTKNKLTNDNNLKK